MNVNEYIKNMMCVGDNEKPLDRIVDGGGLAKIFRTVAVIGDSLSSGEFEATVESTGKPSYHDMYEYSWGQYMARELGCTVYNFSRGGMTAKEYMRSFAANMNMFDRTRAAQAYIIALGVNDIMNYNMPLGKVGDMWNGDLNISFDEDTTSFCGYYCAIIERYKEISPDSKFFLVSMPKGHETRPDLMERRKSVNDLLYEIAARYKNTYVIDLYNYMPVNAGEYMELFYLGGHLNPMGYIFTAKVIASYVDYIIRKNREDFIQVPFIGKGVHNLDAKW